MEYHKYLKYKTKYLQLKMKIERETNNEDNNIIVPARSPLQQMRLHTYENEQTGGFTFLTGYYAFFCNSKHFPNYKDGDEAPTFSEIQKRLSYKGYSLKLFTDRFAKKQGTKLNLVISRFSDSQISDKKIQDFIEKIDEDNSRNDKSSVIPRVALMLILGIVGYPIYKVLWYATGSKGGKIDKLWDEFEEWMDENDNKAAIAERTKRHEEYIRKFKEKYLTEIILVTRDLVGNRLPEITNVAKNKKEIINNSILDNFLNKELRNLNKESLNIICDAEEDYIKLKKQSVELQELAFRSSSPDHYRQKDVVDMKIKLLGELKETDNYKTIKHNVDSYNRDNKIDCCVIIDINFSSKNIFLKKYSI
jgi:hypothetical protein